MQELRDIAPGIVVTKTRFGAFSTTNLRTILGAHGIEHIVLFGVATGGVVESTARDAFDMVRGLFLLLCLSHLCLVSVVCGKTPVWCSPTMLYRVLFTTGSIFALLRILRCCIDVFPLRPVSLLTAHTPGLCGHCAERRVCGPRVRPARRADPTRPAPIGQGHDH